MIETPLGVGGETGAAWESDAAMRLVRPAPGAPRLGFAGVGWIGRLRMEAVIEAGAAQVVAVADPVEDLRDKALELAPDAIATPSFQELLEMDLDGVVIATPSALHAEQSIAALERGIAVFCQKPLARTAAETRRVIAAAAGADRLLGIDLVYRTTEAVRALRAAVDSGALGTLYTARLVFHNAYGPDKAWFYDRALSGGGCVMDLGTHLIDLGLLLFGHPRVTGVHSRLYQGGRRIEAAAGAVEDYASIQLDLEGGATVDIACSWNLPAGCDAVIEASLVGTEGGAAMRNVGGSFYDFTAELYHRTARRVLCQPPDDWGGRALLEWVEQLTSSPRHDPRIERAMDVARVIDRVYGDGHGGAGA